MPPVRQARSADSRIGFNIVATDRERINGTDDGVSTAGDSTATARARRPRAAAALPEPHWPPSVASSTARGERPEETTASRFRANDQVLGAHQPHRRDHRPGSTTSASDTNATKSGEHRRRTSTTRRPLPTSVVTGRTSEPGAPSPRAGDGEIRRVREGYTVAGDEPAEFGQRREGIRIAKIAALETAPGTVAGRRHDDQPWADMRSARTDGPQRRPRPGRRLARGRSRDRSPTATAASWSRRPLGRHRDALSANFAGPGARATSSRSPRAIHAELAPARSTDASGWLRRPRSCSEDRHA